MYSGSDSTESQNYTQWALNPTNYKSGSSEQVDWAALAQQWIIMKEAGPPVPDQVHLTAPPPPIISDASKNALQEGGEAPMDIEVEKSNTQSSWGDLSESQPWSWQPTNNQSSQSWNWDSSWPVPTGVPPPATVKPPLLPTPQTFNQSYSSTNDPDVNNFSG